MPTVLQYPKWEGQPEHCKVFFWQCLTVAWKLEPELKYLIHRLRVDFPHGMKRLLFLIGVRAFHTQIHFLEHRWKAADTVVEVEDCRHIAMPITY